MKKKILAVALVLLLLATVVGGTLAYFTAEDEVTNTFTIGSVKIEIFENGNPTTEDAMPFGAMMPIVNMDKPSEDDSYFEKVVTVKNVGANDAYIRTHIAIPEALLGYLCLDLADDGWSRQEENQVMVNGIYYTVYTYDYTAAVPGGGTTGQLLKGVYLNYDVDLVEDAAGNLLFVRREKGAIVHESGFVAHTKTPEGYKSTTVNVLVAAQAIQSKGFENGGASVALDTGFGRGTNPWQ